MRKPAAKSKKKKKKQKRVREQELKAINTDGMAVRDIVNMIKQREAETIECQAKERALKATATELEERFLMTRPYRLRAMQLREALQDEEGRVESIRRSKQLALERRDAILAEISELEAAVAAKRPAVERLKREIALEKRGNEGRKKKTRIMEEQMRLFRTAAMTEVELTVTSEDQLRHVVAGIRRTRALRLAGCEHLNRELRALRRIATGVRDETYYESSEEEAQPLHAQGEDGRPSTSASRSSSRAAMRSRGRSRGSAHSRAAKEFGVATAEGIAVSSTAADAIAAMAGGASDGAPNAGGREPRPTSAARSGTAGSSRRLSAAESTQHPTSAGIYESGAGVGSGVGERPSSGSTAPSRPTTAAGRLEAEAHRRVLRSAPAGLCSPSRPRSRSRSRSPESRPGSRPSSPPAPKQRPKTSGAMPSVAASGGEESDGGATRPGSRKKKRGARGKRGVYKRTKRKKKAECVALHLVPGSPFSLFSSHTRFLTSLF